MGKFVFLINIPFLLNFIAIGQSDLFTALADLEDLLETESLLINTLDNYIEAEEQKLDRLKKYAQIYKKQHNKASEDVQTYVANPINAYILIKRLTTDWKKVEVLLNTNVSTDYLTNITTIKETMKFPTDEDLNGAVIALMRLQDTYRLDTSSLARGELNGVKYSAELNADDCFELGKQSFDIGDFYHSFLWMKEADARLNREMNTTVEKSDILEYLAFSTYKQGNLSLALDLTNKLLEIVPTHPRAFGNKVYYKNELEKTVQMTKKDEDDSEALQESSSVSYFDELKLYKQLCRGEISLPPEKTAKFKCRYLRRNNPFLLLAPFKIEEAHHEPDIWIFHDVLTDDEIDTIRNLAQPRFKRAGVQNTDTGKIEFVHYRISKAAWLKENDHKLIADVSQRISDMTGLTMETAEELQVGNYGIGGHYEPHFDFARKHENEVFKDLGTGNRIATVLFYMSDVLQGGATVFPAINVALWPKKGSAAFWYNLHPSGDGDKMTQHAACPVLAGSKWVSNKWIHEKGQEFRRPCTLERPSEDLVA